MLVPLHNPMHLAKQAATLQELSSGRLRLGIGMGWHKDEFDFMGVEFDGRGRRGDEAIRPIRALWNGERDLAERWWSFHDATAEPHPLPQPEIWVGGSSDPATRRAQRSRMSLDALGEPNLSWGLCHDPRRDGRHHSPPDRRCCGDCRWRLQWRRGAGAAIHAR